MAQSRPKKMDDADSILAQQGGPESVLVSNFGKKFGPRAVAASSEQRVKIAKHLQVAFPPRQAIEKALDYIETCCTREKEYWVLKEERVASEVQQLQATRKQLVASLKDLAEGCRFQSGEENDVPPVCSEGSLKEQVDHLELLHNKLTTLKGLQGEVRERFPEYSPSKDRFTWDNLEYKIKQLQQRLAAPTPALDSSPSTPPPTSPAPFAPPSPSSPGPSTSIPQHTSPGSWRSKTGSVDAKAEVNESEEVLKYLEEEQFKRQALEIDGKSPLKQTALKPGRADLPFIERGQDVEGLVIEMALAYKGMREGNEDPKEGRPRLAYVEGPTGSGKTRLMRELSRFCKQPHDGALKQALSNTDMGTDLAGDFVRLLQSERNSLTIYLDFMKGGMPVEKDELEGKDEWSGLSRCSEALRILCGYLQKTPSEVCQGLGALARKLDICTVMDAIKKHHMAQFPTIPGDGGIDDQLLVLLIKDEGHKMVHSPGNPNLARQYGRDMILATQAYCCTAAEETQSLASQQGIALYTIVAGTLLRELMPPSDSQYSYKPFPIDTIEPQRARAMLEQFVEKIGGEAPTAAQKSLRDAAEFIFNDPRMRAMIQDTAGVFRLIRHLADAITEETPDMVDMRTSGNWTVWLSLVACQFLKKMKQHFGVNFVSQLGGRDVVTSILHLILSGYPVHESEKMGVLPAVGGEERSITLLETMRSGILYYERVGQGRFRLISPAAQLCRLVGEVGYSLPLTAYEYPAGGPIDPKDFELAIGQRESAFARVLFHYTPDKMVTFKTAFGEKAIMSLSLKGARMQILAADAPLLRESAPFLDPCEPPSIANPSGHYPVSPVVRDVKVRDAAASVRLEDGRSIFMTDSGEGSSCPHFDLRYVRGNPTGKKPYLIVCSAKRWLAEKAMSLEYVSKWYSEATTQMQLYENEFEVVYTIVASCPMQEAHRDGKLLSVRDFVERKSNIVIVDVNGLGAYLPIVGQRSILLKYNRV